MRCLKAMRFVRAAGRASAATKAGSPARRRIHSRTQFAGTLGLGAGVCGAGGLGGDVEAHHDAGVHGDEVDLGHVVVQPGDAAGRPARPGRQRIRSRARLGPLGLLLAPGHQDTPGAGR